MNFKGSEWKQSNPGSSSGERLLAEILPGFSHPFSPWPVDSGEILPRHPVVPWSVDIGEILPRPPRPPLVPCPVRSGSGLSHSFVPPPVDSGDLTLDDCVVDYPPTASGSCRIHKIWSSGCKCNLGAPFGITYIFVQGKDSACLVTGDIRGKRMSYEYENFLMSLADFRFEGASMFKKHGDLDQFAVVSVLLAPNVVSMILPHDELNKEIVCEFDEASGSFGNQAAINLLKESSGSFEKRAIYFLKEVLEKDSSLIIVKTIEVKFVCCVSGEIMDTSQEDTIVPTAISALQYLYDKKFQANEIKVFVAGELGRFKLLLPEEEIVQYLEAINKNPNNVSWPLYRPLEPGDTCDRFTIIQLGSSESYTVPHLGINFIFVQGKKSACIATCDMDKNQDRTKTLNDLHSQYIRLVADFKLLRSIRAQMSIQPVDVELYAAVCALFDSDMEKGSTTTSGHKVSRFDQEAAIGILSKGLESHCIDSLNGIVQLAIFALYLSYMKLQADEIEVCVLEAGVLTLLGRDDIASHLANFQDGSGLLNMITMKDATR